MFELQSRYGECTLSSKGHYLSSVITTVAGGLVTGLTHGGMVGFFTAWMAWFATLRIFLVGVWYLSEVIRGHDLDREIPVFKARYRQIHIVCALARREDLLKEQEKQREGGDLKMADLPSTATGSHEPPPYSSSPNLAPNQPSDPTLDISDRETLLAFVPSHGRAAAAAKLSKYSDADLGKKSKAYMRFVGINPNPNPPSILGWLGWLYPALLFPLLQILWMTRNFASTSTGLSSSFDSPFLSPDELEAHESAKLKLVRALGISVTALPLTIDTKARYAASLRRRWGGWAGRAFAWTHALATFALGLMAVMLAVKAAVEVGQAALWFVIVGPIGSVVWTLFSLVWFVPTDGALSVTPNSVPTVLWGLMMGVWAAAFTSAPAVAMMVGADSADGMALGEFLQCSGGNVLDKVLAVLP